MFLNYSRASLFNQCRRKWALEYFIGGGVVPEQEDDRLLIGQAVHKGLESLYLNDPMAAIKAADYYNDSRSEHWNGALLEEWMESNDLVRRMVHGYSVREYPKDDFSIVHTERSFAVPLGEVCYECGEPYGNHGMICQECGAEIHSWVGTLDLLVNRKGDGPHDRFAVLDHKTTASTPSDDFLNNFARSFQLLGYVYGAEKDSGLKIREYGVNALQKAKTIGTEASELKACPSCRNGSKKRLTCKECNTTGKVEKKIKLKPFRRKWFTVDDSDIDRFVLWALTTVKEIEKEIELFKTEPEIAFPMNDKICNLYGGCPMQAICWENQNALKWYEPPNELLAGLKPRKEDYLDKYRVASEEMV